MATPARWDCGRSVEAVWPTIGSVHRRRQHQIRTHTQYSPTLVERIIGRVYTHWHRAERFGPIRTHWHGTKRFGPISTHAHRPGTDLLDLSSYIWGTVIESCLREMSVYFLCYFKSSILLYFIFFYTSSVLLLWGNKVPSVQLITINSLCVLVKAYHSPNLGEC